MLPGAHSTKKSSSISGGGCSSQQSPYTMSSTPLPSVMSSATTQPPNKKRKMNIDEESQQWKFKKRLLTDVENEIKRRNQYRNESYNKPPGYNSTRPSSIRRSLIEITNIIYRPDEQEPVMECIKAYVFPMNGKQVNGIEHHRKELIQKLDDKHRFLSKYDDNQRKQFKTPSADFQSLKENFEIEQKEKMELRINLQELKERHKALQRRLDIEKNLHAKASSKNCQLDMDYKKLHQEHQDTLAVNKDLVGQIRRYQEREMKMKQLFSK